MSTALATHDDFTEEKVALLKRTICKGSTDDEFALFVSQCKRTGLDPFAKQIHAVKRWDKKANREIMQVQVGIDGYRLIAERTGLYAGNDDPVFDNEDQPRKATVTVYKLVGGVRCPFTASARWEQYYPGDKQGFMWNRMPHLMLGKCAEALALRKAFPAELSGLYTSEEMEQANARQPIVAPAVKELPPAEATPATEEQEAEAQEAVRLDHEAALDLWSRNLSICFCLPQLVDTWTKMPAPVQKELVALKDDCKSNLQKEAIDNPELAEARETLYGSLKLVRLSYASAMQLYGWRATGWEPRRDPLWMPESLTISQLRHLTEQVQAHKS